MDTQEQKIIWRSYSSVFILDSAKLSRLTNVIEDRFKSLDLTPIRHFELHTQKGKAFSAQSLEHILEHDNAVKNPIVTLKITFNDKADDPTNSCTIIFNKYPYKTKHIDVRIQGEHSKWTNDLFSEIDEQIERAFVSNWVYSIKSQRSYEGVFALGATVMALFALIAVTLDTTKGFTRINYMTPADVEYLQRLGTGVKQQEEKIEFIYQVLSRQVNNVHEQAKDLGGSVPLMEYVNLKSALVLLPAVVIILSLAYLIKYCYPGSVFLWGDFIEHYNAIIERRKFVWSTIVISLLVGILGNLFVFVVSPFMLMT